MEDRVILHCDCNSFYASVETVLHPEYKNVPMAVCGSIEDRHGIVLAKNELAKRYGIVTAETVFSAKKKCPELVIAQPHHLEYVRYSKAVSRILMQYTDLIEPFGIDESWLDVTASRKLFGDGLQIADRIRCEIKEKLGISVSIGVSFNKVFAKLGSDYKKPDAITVISRENYRDIVFPLPVGDLLFVGKNTNKALQALGIRTIGELAAASVQLLVNRFGKMGELLHRYANGNDESPVSPEYEDPKSIGNGYTYRQDLESFEVSKRAIQELTEHLGAKLRKNKMKCTTVSLKVKDPFLRTFQKQCPIDPPSDSDREIADTAYSLLKMMWIDGKPIRALTVTVSGLMKADTISEQITMFPDDRETQKREKNSKRELAIDKIRDKFGNSAIRSASGIGDIDDFQGKYK